MALERSVVAQFPVLSADGARLLVSQAGQLAVYDLVAGQSVSLPMSGMNPVWSPDGQWIALVQVVEGIYQVHLVRPDGSEIRQVFEWAGFPVVTWSDDGQYLAVEASPAADQPASSFFLVSVDGTARELGVEGGEGYELRFPSFRR